MNDEQKKDIVLPGFGSMESERVFGEDDLFVVIADANPISPGHSLIIPKRQAPLFRDMDEKEKERLLYWIDWAEEYLKRSLNPHPDAFNIGLNDGQAAGQTIPQFHLHIIPRYIGDVADPRGGVRHLFTEKAKYWKK